MTSIRDLVSESLAIGETFCLVVERRDDALVAAHPSAASPMDLLVCEGLGRLEERPPTGPVEVEVVGRVVEGRLVGRVVGAECDSPVNEAADVERQAADERKTTDQSR